MDLLVGLPVLSYHQSVFLKRLPIQQYIFRAQAGSTPLGDASIVYPRDVDAVCVLTSGFHFIIRVHFNLTTKGLNIPRQLLLLLVFLLLMLLLFLLLLFCQYHYYCSHGLVLLETHCFSNFFDLLIYTEFVIDDIFVV